MDSRVVLALFLALCIIYYAHGQTQTPFHAQCTTAGRVANTADATCQTYFLCVFVAANSTFVGYTYTCPTTSVFNPALGRCTTNYNCPNANTTTTNNICTTDGFVADPNVTDCSSYIQCTQINGTFVQTQFTCPPTTFYNPATTLCDPNFNCSTTFTCSAPGRFPNPVDTTCQSYYFCVATNVTGTFNQFNYTCPTISVFSPLSRMCTTTYVCPQQQQLG